MFLLDFVPRLSSLPNKNIPEKYGNISMKLIDLSSVIIIKLISKVFFTSIENLTMHYIHYDDAASPYMTNILV